MGLVARAEHSCTINVSGPRSIARTSSPVPARSVWNLPRQSKFTRDILTVTAFAAALAGGVSLQAASLYADPAVCAQCHPAIAATYRKTGMGRSFRKLRSEKDLDAAAPVKPFYHAASNSFFNMIF